MKAVPMKMYAVTIFTKHAPLVKHNQLNYL